MSIDVVVSHGVFLASIPHLRSWKSIAREATFVPFTQSEFEHVFTLIANRDEDGLIAEMESQIAWRKLAGEPGPEWIIR